MARTDAGRWRRASRFYLPVRAEAGVAALEFALVAPVFLLMFLGVVEFGRLLWMQSTLQQATEAAARCASVDQSVCSSGTATASYAASQAYGLSLPSGTFAETAANCGYQVSASLPFIFAAQGLFPWRITLAAQSCYPSQSQGG